MSDVHTRGWGYAKKKAGMSKNIFMIQCMRTSHKQVNKSTFLSDFVHGKPPQLRSPALPNEAACLGRAVRQMVQFLRSPQKVPCFAAEAEEDG